MKTLIAVPAKHIFPVEFVINLFALVDEIKKISGCKVRIDTTTPLQTSRENLVGAALNGEFSHIFFIDADVIVPYNAFEILARKKKDIINGVYFQSCEPYNVVAKKDGKLLDVQANQLYEVDYCGLGCSLIKTSVFEKVQRPYFKFENDEGEDVYFFRKCRDAGFKVFLDSSVVCRHWGSATGLENYLWVREAEKRGLKSPVANP